MSRWTPEQAEKVDRWARAARAAEEVAREVIRACPPAAQVLDDCLAAQRRKFDTLHLPAALAVLRTQDVPAWRQAAPELARAAALRWQMVDALKAHVRHHARRHTGRIGLEKDDALQTARIGAYRGCCCWDPDGQAALHSYASWWIRAALTDSLAREQRPVRLSSGVIEGILQLRALLAVHPAPTVAQIIAELGVTPRRAQYIQQALHTHTVSLDAPAPGPGGEENPTLGSLLQSEEDPEQLITQLDSEILRGHLSTALKGRDLLIVSRRYGLDGRPPEGLAAIARKLGLSRERVRQLHVRALLKLRACLLEPGERHVA